MGRAVTIYYLLLLILFGFFLAIVTGDWNAFKYFDSTGTAILLVGVPLVALQTIKTLHMK